jgi:hypothetical protein
VTGAHILGGTGHEDLNQGQISSRVVGNQATFLIKQALCGFQEANTVDTISYNQIQAPI